MIHRVPIEGALDLHAFQPADAVSVVEEYLTAAAEAGLTEVRIVHGRGHGVLRAQVQQAIDRHPCVVEFWDDPRSQLGATLARIRPLVH